MSESKSATQKLHGFTIKPDEGHMAIYGSDAFQIRFMLKEHPEWREKLHPKYPYTIAEVIWIIRNEMAVKLEDVLSRRFRILLLDARAAMEMAPKVVEIMAKELGMDQNWIEDELKEFKKTANKYIIKP
jgi:glycerol-3-phosphate dehydrogenase